MHSEVIGTRETHAFTLLGLSFIFQNVLPGDSEGMTSWLAGWGWGVIAHSRSWSAKSNARLHWDLEPAVRHGHYIIQSKVMAGKRDFSWDRAFSYAACLYVEFIALCQWVNCWKVKAYRVQSYRFMFSMYTCPLFKWGSTTGDITKPRITLRKPDFSKTWGQSWESTDFVWVIYVCECTDCMHWFKLCEQLCAAVCFLVVSFPLCPWLCSPLSLIPLVSTSKYRARMCLGGDLLVVVVKEKTGYLP